MARYIPKGWRKKHQQASSGSGLTSMHVRSSGPRVFSLGIPPDAPRCPHCSYVEKTHGREEVQKHCVVQRDGTVLGIVCSDSWPLEHRDVSKRTREFDPYDP